VLPSPMRTLWALHPIKGHTVSQIMAPWGCLKMTQGWYAGGFHRTEYMFLQDMLKDHSTPGSWLPSPTECVLIEIYQKAIPSLTLNFPPQQKRQNKNPTMKTTVSHQFPQAPLHCSSCSLSFLSNKSYLSADLVSWSQFSASLDNSLASESKDLRHRPTAHWIGATGSHPRWSS
jgi:hypothetical protein